VLQGTQTYILQDGNGNIELTHSISAGLDYAAVGPEHAWLREQGRTEYVWIDDQRALEGFQQLANYEGILCALESAHAVTYACDLASTLRPAQAILVNLSGRGDKDVQTIANRLADDSSDTTRFPQDDGTRP
jgi:tryptophan synthase beta chain